MRSEISKRSCERLELPGRSKIKMTANGFGTLPVSIARNARSAELARSMIDRSSFGVSTLCMSRIVDAPCQLHGPTDQYWTSRWRTLEGPMGRDRFGGRRSSLRDDKWLLYMYEPHQQCRRYGCQPGTWRSGMRNKIVIRLGDSPSPRAW
jgi:hypothetical protein